MKDTIYELVAGIDMKKFFLQNKVNILTTLFLMYLFTYFIKPILNTVGMLITKFFSKFSRKFEIDFYGGVGQLETSDLTFFIYIFIFGIPLAFLLAINVNLLFGSFVKNKPNRKKKEKLSTSALVSTTRKIISRLLLFLIMLLFLVNVANEFYTASLATTFRTNMKVIAPYISELEEEQIISEWTLINSEAKYKAVSDKVKEIAVANSIELPENKILSLTSF